MSEIEKMYKNANVKKDWNSLPYGDIEEFYPPFTTEKKIKLIILLANREIRISPTYISSGYYLNDLNKIKSSRNISTFENSLAQHINAIWQDLTETEQEEIRKILKG